MNGKLTRGLAAGLAATSLWCLTLAAGPAVQAEETLPVQAVEKADWQVKPAYAQPMLDVAPGADTIMGPATISPEEMVHFIRKRNEHPKLNAPLEDVVKAYYEEAGREGIRPDVALCQALKETGYFSYGGDVSPEQNNFCGLGATGNGAPGASFATPQLGVRAHIQHLLAYARTERPQTAIVDPRYELLVQNHPELYGKVTTWTGLNGRWAVPGKHYGQEILWMWTEAQTPDGSDDDLLTGFEKVILHRDDPASYLYRGILFFHKGYDWLAEEDFRRAIQKNDQSPAAWYDLALTQEKRGEPQAALESYDKAIAARPEFLEAWYNRGILSMNLGKDREALHAFEEILRFSPQSADAANAMAVIYLRQGNYAAGRQALKKAGLINTTNERVKFNQKQLPAYE